MTHPGGDAHEYIEARTADVVLVPVGRLVRIRGRLVPTADGGVAIVDAQGRIRVRGVDTGSAHAWVSLEARVNEDGSVACLGCTPHTPARAAGVDGELARLVTNDGRLADALRLRARARVAVRAFFDTRGYLEVETPAIVRNPGSDLHLDAFEVVGLGAPRFLSTSPELQMKRLVVGGLDRIYQLRAAYRRDELGAHHEPEFTMLEWYRTFASHDDLLTDTEALIQNVVQAATGRDHLVVDGRRVSLDGPWPRRTIREVYRTYVGGDVDAFALSDDDFFQLFAERIQPALGHDVPEHVVEWPARFASLARISRTDPTVCERVETFIGGIELSNGFVELVDPDEQSRRFALDEDARRAHAKIVYARDERFVDALRDGLPDTVGNALGFDRLVMLMAGASAISDVIAIPAARV